ncbi:exodeoxyribonuclease V subunit beta [Noviherbaspirillum aerium]|uniref:exodeoxyribonuclease V subunit beta n=1 Tax=Noviherbaspirillum aerium TaxID=2588497 RepID=UPI00124DBB9F|nr:exodeoxyribonuclease V subunit beta [Noviherbaspirillum aerium]
MSQLLDPIDFPLHGARLIEASAGTGKTWTIAALYVRLVLGHGGECGFSKPLQPSEILVMTFTRAATRELSDRIRARLVEAAAFFRGEHVAEDDFLLQLADCYPEQAMREQAARRLMLAAEAMDESAVFTIDAWCQRMLREHAFDSGCLFDEELISSERQLKKDAVRDYWRHHVYSLDRAALAAVQQCWMDLDAFENALGSLVERAHLLECAQQETLSAMLARIEQENRRCADQLRKGWAGKAAALQAWLADNRGAISGTKLQPGTAAAFFEALHEWAASDKLVKPRPEFFKGAPKMVPAALQAAFNKGKNVELPAECAELEGLLDALNAITPLEHALLTHSAVTIAKRMAELKQRSRQFGFADMLSRLKSALHGDNGEALRKRIITQYPVALIDEFQDTSPDQYRIFDALYRVGEENASLALFMIGDPKQAIYGFRGADIHSYLAARRATEGRHFRLTRNFRSTEGVVRAVNHLFLHAEGSDAASGHPRGAFGFRDSGINPLPFEEVTAHGRKECLVADGKGIAALTIWSNENDGLVQETYRTGFAAQCAEKIATLLGNPGVGFSSDAGFERLRPADIAILVRDRYEAEAIRAELERRRVPSVYLSDKDSVFDSEEAADVLRWMHAVSNPLDGALGRAAYATRTVGFSLPLLAEIAADDARWDACIEQLKAWRLVWQRHGVLAMLRQLIHDLDIPARLLQEASGERRLTNLLHLAELLQKAGTRLDGEQALIRWLAAQIEGEGESDDERILRLESDDQLVKIVTVYKSKGLEYPLVFLPFAVSARRIAKGRSRFLEIAERSGTRRIDFALAAETIALADQSRLEEELRLFYVALTRARHALWMGVASLDGAFHHCAFGYLLAGGNPVVAAALTQTMRDACASCAHIDIEVINTEEIGCTTLARDEQQAALGEAAEFDAQFERGWSVSSYTSITRDLGPAPALATTAAPGTPAEDKLLEDDDVQPLPSLPALHRRDGPWHRFPRGSLPGQFLHAQLEWLAGEGFAAANEADFATRLAARCERAGWGNHQEDTIEWVIAACTTELPPLRAALSDLARTIPEMEFWVPLERVGSRDIDLLCRTHLLPGEDRPALAERQLQGMLRGFQDLVFEHDGRYWVMDYKSNQLAGDDAGYHRDALAKAVVANRYDVQGTIYLLALHRLLKSRLGADYDPAEKLGGVVFFFLRGINNGQTRGCHHMPADAALLDELEALLAEDKEETWA